MIHELFKRLLPIQIILAAIGTINGIVSGIYGSNFIGSDVMSVIGLYNPVNMIFTTISTVFLGGTQVLSGKYLGRNEFERTHDIFSLDMIIMTLLGLTITFVLFVFARPIGILLGADETTIVHLVPYLRGVAIGMIPLFLSQQLSAFLALEQQSLRTGIGSVVFIAINIILGYVFVAKMHMGAFGLSLASSIGLWVFTFFLAQFYFTGKSIMNFKWKGLKLVDVQDILGTGYAGALSFAYQVVRGFVLNAIILKNIGNMGVAALATYTTINSLLWSFPAGIIAVGRLLLSVSNGEEDKERCTQIMRTVIFRYAVYDLIFSLGVGLFASQITGIYYQDPTSPVFEMTKMAIKLVPPSMFLSIICVIFISWGQIIMEHPLVHILSLIDGLVGTVLFSFLFISTLKMNAVWISYTFNGILTTIVIYLYAWYNNKARPKVMADLMMIPKGFGENEEDIINLEVKRKEDVVLIGKEIQSFCKKKNIDSKRGYYAALSMEEMASNILEHGFTKDNKKHKIDVRVMLKDDDIIMRIKDDCVPFNPKERKDITLDESKEDPLKNIGIRMAYKLAKDITYEHILGLNV